MPRPAAPRSRHVRRPGTDRHTGSPWRLLGLAGILALLLAGGAPAGAATAGAARPAPAGRRARATPRLAVAAAQRTWCATHGSTVAAWTRGPAVLPVCGPGPAYGGTYAYVDLPGPGGSMARYYNATPGFQCVELAERWLALVDHLAPVRADGSTLAGAYHAAYPDSTLVVDGTPGAVDHPPAAGDVISFSMVPSFADPTFGHVAVVLHAAVDPATGNGTVLVAQENVAPSDYLMVLRLARWRLYDPAEPADAGLQYPDAAWFHLLHH